MLNKENLLKMSVRNNAKELNRVVIQGIPGAFHEIAARQYFPNKGLIIQPANSFDILVNALENGTAVNHGIMAIENSIAGSLLYNYQLLSESSLKIVGEVYLRIKHNLMCMPGVSIDELEEVHSHPMAIAQCRNFFKQYPHIKLISTEDTALSAKRVRANKWKTKAAIASSLAAQLYDLDMIAESIETNKKNYTRFLILSRQSVSDNNQTYNKVSICFKLKHEIGSLHRVLMELALQQANLSKIESAPILGSEWQYRFFIDFIFDENVDADKVIEALQPLTSELIVLGKYTKGTHYEN